MVEAIFYQARDLVQLVVEFENVPYLKRYKSEDVSVASWVSTHNIKRKHVRWQTKRLQENLLNGAQGCNGKNDKTATHLCFITAAEYIMQTYGFNGYPYKTDQQN